MQLSGVRLSVMSHSHAADVGLLLWARQSEDIDRLLQVSSSRAAARRACGQCHAVSQEMLLNTNL